MGTRRLQGERQRLARRDAVLRPAPGRVSAQWNSAGHLGAWAPKFARVRRADVLETEVLTQPASF